MKFGSVDDSGLIDFNLPPDHSDTDLKIPNDDSNS